MLHCQVQPWTSCLHTLSSALWRYINQLKLKTEFFLNSEVRQTKLAFKLVKFQAHYKIVGLYVTLPSRYLSRPLNSVILSWVGAMSTANGFGHLWEETAPLKLRPDGGLFIGNHK